MQLYFLILKFHTLGFFMYPLEIFAMVLKKILKIIFLVIFWNLILENSTITKTIYELLAYFLISSSVSEILMSYSTDLGRSIRKSVKYGEINQILIKPLKLIPYFYATTLGKLSVSLVISFVSLFIGIFLIKDFKFENLILFALFLVPGFLISLSFNLFEGGLSLIFNEVAGIKNAINHTSRVLSGVMIPLTFFPEGVRNIIAFLPFGFYTFYPVNALVNLEEIDNLKFLIYGYFLSIIMLVLILRFWRWCLKKYEGVGM